MKFLSILLGFVGFQIFAFSNRTLADEKNEKQIVSCSTWVQESPDSKKIQSKEESDFVFDAGFESDGQWHNLEYNLKAEDFPDAKFQGDLKVQIAIGDYQIENTIFKPVDRYYFLQLSHLVPTETPDQLMEYGSSESFVSVYSPLMVRLRSFHPSLFQFGITCMHFFVPEGK